MQTVNVVQSCNFKNETLNFYESMVLLEIFLSSTMGKDISLVDIVNKCSCILLDIEGTITSVEFVKHLYSYSLQYMPIYIKEHWNDEAIQNAASEVLNTETNKNEFPENEKCLTTDYTNQLDSLQNAFIDKFQKQKSKEKSPIMKVLEGLVIKNLFMNGDLQGHIYPDAVSALKLWKREGKKIYIYSNGSVANQQLLFQYSIHGDLLKYIDGNFDTNIGSKLESPSYDHICKEIHKQGSDIVFFSDHPQELLAAKECGMRTVLVVRDPEQPMFLEERKCLPPEIPIISSFSQFFPTEKSLP